MNKFVKSKLYDQAIDWLVKLNSQSISTQDEKQFFEWLEASPAHQAAYLEAEHIWSQSENVVMRLQPQKTQQTIRWSALAAVSCSLLFSVFLFLNYSVTELDFQTAIGEQRSFALPDQSQILLNTDSKVHVKFDRKHRVTSLTQGEVFFDVKRDESRPFDVVTDNGVVRVLGTHFSVRKINQDTTVSVAEGRVAVGQLEANSSEFSPKVDLTANQIITMREAQKGLLPSTINPTSQFAWKNHQIVFRGEPLESVVAELQRYYPIHITLDGEELQTKRVTAVIRIDNLNSGLQALCSSLGLVMEPNSTGNQIVIRSAR